MAKKFTTLVDIGEVGPRIRSLATGRTAEKATANSGKSNVVESLSNMLGRQLVKTACTSTSQPTALTRMVSGLCLSQSWGLFMEISDLTLQALSVLVEHVRLLQFRVRVRERPTLRQLGLATLASRRSPFSPKIGRAALRSSSPDKDRGIDEPGGDVSFRPGAAFAVFATVSVGHSNPLPEEVRNAWPDLLRVAPFIQEMIKPLDRTEPLAAMQMRLAAGMLEQLGEGPFLGGQTAPTLADLSLFPQLTFGVVAGLEDELSAGRVPAIKDWLSRVAEHLPEQPLLLKDFMVVKSLKNALA